MSLDSRECLRKKIKYEACFKVWYSEVFLKGNAGKEIGCQEEYKAYAGCVKEELKKDPSLLESIDNAMSKQHKDRWKEMENN